MLLVVVSGALLAALLIFCCAVGWRYYLLGCAVLVRGDAESERSPIFWFTSAREFCSLRWALTLFMAMLALATWVVSYFAGLLAQYTVPFLVLGGACFVGLIALFAYFGVTNGAFIHLYSWRKKLTRAELNDKAYVLIFQERDEDALAVQRRLVWGWQYHYWRETPTFEGSLGQLVNELYHLQRRRVALEKKLTKMEQPDPNLQRDLELVRKEIDFEAKVARSIYALFANMTQESAA